MVEKAPVEDVGEALDRGGIAAPDRRGRAQPILPRFGLEATAGPSSALYNRREDVEVRFAAARRVAVQEHGGSR